MQLRNIVVELRLAWKKANNNVRFSLYDRSKLRKVRNCYRDTTHNIELEMGNNMSRNKLHQGTRELFMAYLPKLNKNEKILNSDWTWKQKVYPFQNNVNLLSIYIKSNDKNILSLISSFLMHRMIISCPWNCTLYSSSVPVNTTASLVQG